MSNVMEVTDANFSEEVLNSPVPVLVDFWASWCGPCKMMGPVIDSISKKLAPHMKVVKLNTDQNRKTSDHYSIQGIPSLLVFSGGKEVERLVGFMPENTLEERLKSYSQERA